MALWGLPRKSHELRPKQCGLSDGSVTRARAITRVVPSIRWDADRLKRISATPCSGKVTNLDSIETGLGPHEHDVPETEPGPADHQHAKRRLKLDLKELWKYGFSNG